jgi:hypothetical protein
MKEGSEIIVREPHKEGMRAHIYKGHMSCFPSLEIVLHKKRSKGPWPHISLEKEEALRLHKFLTRLLTHWGYFNENLLKDQK